MIVSADGMIACADERRSGLLRDPAHPLTGIDFVDYRRDLGPPTLEVVLTKPLPAPALGPADAAILGGVRIVGIGVTAVDPHPTDPARLFVRLTAEGDFSTYVLRLASAGLDSGGGGHPALDPERSEARFGFKASCPTEFDCRQALECPGEPLEEPALDYLAKDYQSFRRLLLDLVALRNPRWTERLPADLGITLVELIAYVGDYLSYQQDAAATEAFLDTCLHRISAARHARLVDYRMHHGRSAWTYVQFEGGEGATGVVPAGTKLVTRIARPLIGAPVAPGTVLPAGAHFDRDPALADAEVFETTALCRVDGAHNRLIIHTWGDADCCLAAGSTEAYLHGLAGDGSAFAPNFETGDYLLFEEVLGRATGAEADADPAHRHVVRITSAEVTQDPAFTAALGPRTNAGDPALPLQRVRWRPPLPASLCLSTQTDDGRPILPGIARGNVIPADHGRTRMLDTARGEIPLPDEGLGRWPQPTLRLGAAVAPLAHAPAPAEQAFDAAGRALAGRHELAGPPQGSIAQCVLLLETATGPEVWTPVPHLLDSTSLDQHFVAEIDDEGEATLRFGDDAHGRRPLGVSRVQARLRTGGGRAGNLGAGALVHLVTPDPADPLDAANPGAALVLADITRVYQPLSAREGADAETIAEVRALAPEAHRALQFRAVTVADWVEVALRHPGVAAARASFRWTGSWHTVFVAIHPAERDDLVRLPGGGSALAPAFGSEIKAHLRRFKLAGYDLAVRAAVYVPLEIDVRLCIARGHRRGDVLAAAARALSARDHASGVPGFFHPSAFGFGEAVYLSQLYAVLEAIPGVGSAEVTLFKRYWQPASDELARGRIAMAPFEIARLASDPNHAEDGVLRLSAAGGL